MTKIIVSRGTKTSGVVASAVLSSEAINAESVAAANTDVATDVAGETWFITVPKNTNIWALFGATPVAAIGTGWNLGEGTHEFAATEGDKVSIILDEVTDAHTRAPSILTFPRISGVNRVGSVLTAAAAGWRANPAPIIARKWLRDGVIIAGETASTYTLVAADYKKMISVVETATNAEGETSADSASVGFIAGLAADNTVAPVITGTAQVGATLQTTGGTWVGGPTPTLAYQWFADGVAIAGATASSFDVLIGQLGKVITVKVTGTNVIGSETVTSAATSAVIAA